MIRHGDQFVVCDESALTLSILSYPLAFLTWNIFIIVQVVVVGRFHSFTPSLLVRHLETRGSSQYEKVLNARGKI